MDIQHRDSIDPTYSPKVTPEPYIKLDDLQEMRLSKPKEIEDLLQDCFNSTELFCKVVFWEHFTIPFSGPHRAIFKCKDKFDLGVASGKTIKMKKAIAAPRDIGKTTIINMAFHAKDILYGMTNHILAISKNQDEAIEMTENLKSELTENEFILAMFGDLSTKDFSREAWTVKLPGDPVGTRVHPRGRGQGIRGKKYRRFRPSRIVGDDIEDDESVESEEQRMKYKRWWYRAVCNSVQIYGEYSWLIFLIGTMLHEDSLLSEVLLDEAYDGEIFSICDESYNTLMPEFISTAEVKAKVEEHRKAGKLDEFSSEFMNIPVSPENRIFPRVFPYYSENDWAFRHNRELENVILVDPAKTQNPLSCDTAIIGVAIDVYQHLIYVRRVVSGRMAPHEMYEYIFTMAGDIQASVLGIEMQSIHAYIEYPIHTEMAKRGKFLELVDLKPGGRSKERRIQGLQPFYNRGAILHNQSHTAELEGQLIAYPRGKKRDIIDALAYALDLFESGSRHFQPREGSEGDHLRELELLEAEENHAVYELANEDFMLL